MGWYWSFLYIYIYPQGFYLPWVLLGIDTIIGNPWKPGLEGIAAGHIYYFLTVLHPLAGGKNYCKTPLLVYPKYIFNWNSCFLFLYIYVISFCVPWTTCFISQKLVAFWGEGFQQNNPYRADPNDGYAFRGRGFRLNENNARSSWWTRTNSSSSPEATNATPDSDSDSGLAFRGRGRRLGTS